MTSWVFDITSIRALAYTARTIYAASFAEMPQRLMWGYIVLNMALKNRTILTKIGNPALLATMFGSLMAKQSFTEKVKQKITLSETPGFWKVDQLKLKQLISEGGRETFHETTAFSRV